MSDKVSILSFILFITIFALISFKLLKQGLENKKLKTQFIRLVQEMAILKDLLDKQESVAHKDGFEKFISDSRDWAFQYIEEVQSGLNKFVNDVGPLIDYFDKYGDSMGMIPNYEGMKKISIYFKELKELLPKEEL